MPKAAPVLLYAVLRVVDGDTVEVSYRGGTTVRIIGIDTPETVSPSVPDECGGQAASQVAHELLDDRRIALRFDASQGRYDRYGRTLA
jgi:micrococcal nuclease